MSLLRGLRGRRAAAAAAELPRATGAARTVLAVHTAEGGGRTGPLTRTVPLQQLPGLGGLLHLEVVGPGLVRPGDLEDPVGYGLRGAVELTMVLQGSVEHADGLGNRGRLDAPACRVVAGGAGLVSLVGPSRALRRDGGDLHLVTLRWSQSLPGAVPTVRLAGDVPVRRQGRSRVTAWTGPDAAVPGADGTSVLTVDLAAGAGVDLGVEADAVAFAVVLQGDALVGADLVPATPGQIVVLASDGPRVQLATRLEQDGGAQVLVVTTSATSPALDGAEEGRIVTGSEEEAQAVREHRAQGGFGTLPGLDG